MKNATDNAGDILDAAQADVQPRPPGQITQEIAEIVGGAAALQG
jgi:F0F1-type ATP synthase gamma subunit